MNSFTIPQKIISYILKAIVIVCAVVGIYMSAAAGAHSFMGSKTTFMYFTIQSNILIALISAVGAVLMSRTGRISNAWYVFKFVGTVSITLTGAVFCFVLAPTFGPAAWNVQNILTHVIVPIAAVIDFFVTGINGCIQKKNVVYVTIPPILYAIYAGIGYVLGWEFSRGINYPYFFLNWGSPVGAFGFTDGLPFMGCVWWILLLLVMLLLVGWLYLVIVDGLKKLCKRG